MNQNIEVRIEREKESMDEIN